MAGTELVLLAYVLEAGFLDAVPSQSLKIAAGAS